MQGDIKCVNVFFIVLLQDLAVRGLRVTKVHELVHELVNDNKVVSDALLLQLLEVLREHL